MGFRELALLRGVKAMAVVKEAKEAKEGANPRSPAARIIAAVLRVRHGLPTRMAQFRPLATGHPTSAEIMG